MPPIGVLIGGLNFKDIVVNLKDAVTDPATGKILREAVTLKIGNFIQSVVDFVIVAFAIFMIIKAFTNFSKKKAEEIPAAPPAPTKDQELLTEIRDLLKRT